MDVACLGNVTKRKKMMAADVKIVTGDEMELTNCLNASIIDYNGPLIPPSFRIRQKCIDIKTTTTVGIATQCKI